MSIRSARSVVWALPLSLLAIACGDDEATSASGTGGAATTVSGSGGAPSDMPPDVGSPSTIVAPEGRTVTSPVTASDPDGGPVTVTVTAPPGVEGEVAPGEDGFTLRLRAGYDVADGAAVIAATDEAGSTSDVEVAVDVIPIAWTDVVEWTDEGPEAREHASVLVDDASGSIYVMFGSGYDPYLEPLGDAWRFDVATRAWSEVTLEGDVPPPAGSRRLAGVRGSGEGWLYGGYGEGSAAFGEVYRVVADGDVLSFEELAQENPPGERVLHVFAYDPGTDTFAMFGGVTTLLKGDTWTMRVDDGVAVWTEIETGPIAGGAPPARYGAFSAMDEELGRLVVFSGQTSIDDFGQDTWILDLRAEGGPTWTQVTPEGSPAGRRNGTSVWDPTGPRLFVFGGTSDGATSQPGLFAFDARPGHESWSEITRAGQPPMRSSGFGAFVAGGVAAPASEGAVWMGFGNDDDVYTDLARLGY